MRVSVKLLVSTPRALPALLYLVLALLHCTLVLASCEAPPLTSSTQASQPTTPTVPPATPTKVAQKTVELSDIHMIDATTGWATTADGYHLLHTLVGATSWQDVTPTFNPTQYKLGTATFLDAGHAWVVLRSNVQTSLVASTSNGGQTWLQAPVPDTGVEINFMTFITPNRGWLLFTRETGMEHEAVDIFTTTNGGAQWTKISSSDNAAANSSSAPPLGGYKSGLSFLNASTGWLTGSLATNKGVLLYVTHNGGTTWQQQFLPLPSHIPTQVDTLPPTFFSSSEGILPVIFDAGSGTVLTIYATHDGGNTWQSTAAVPGAASAVDFIDATHGWAAINANAPQSLLYTTSDGGQQWTQLSMRLPSEITSIANLHFVSKTQGWILCTKQSGASYSTALFQTRDGGQTWHPLTAQHD